MARPPVYQFPQAYVRFELIVDDVGQDDPKALIPLAGFPSEVSVVWNNYQEADTASVTVAFDDFPFEPRILVGGVVEVFLDDAEQIDPGHFPRMTGSQLKERCIFAGMIDKVEGVFDEAGRRSILECRDYTAFLLDASPEAGEIEFGNKTLYDILRGLLDARDSTKRIEIDDRDGVAASVRPSEYMVRGSEAGGEDDTSTFKVEEGDSVWDVMQRLWLAAGLIGYIDLDQLVIRRPTTLYKGEAPPAGSAMYLLGGNLLSATFSREMGRRTDIHVRVTSYNPDTGETLTAVSPKVSELRAEAGAPRVASAPVASGKKTKTSVVQVTPYVVNGITSPEHLQRVADELRESLIHHETEIRVSTKSLYDAQAKPVVSLKYGDPVVVGLSDTLDSILVKPAAEQIQDLLDRGWQQADAKKLADALSSLEVPPYLHEARIDFDAKSGVSIELTLRTRQEVRLEEQS